MPPLKVWVPRTFAMLSVMSYVWLKFKNGVPLKSTVGAFGTPPKCQFWTKFSLSALGYGILYDRPSLPASKVLSTGVMCRSFRDEPKTNSLVRVGLMIVVRFATKDQPGAPKLIGAKGML